MNPEEIITDTPKHFSWKKIIGLSHRGIYSKKDIETFRRTTMDVIHSKAANTNLVRSLKGQSRLFEGVSITNSMSMEDILKLKNSFFESSFDWVWHKINSLGNITSGLLGLFIIIKTFKFFINLIINSILLKDTFGCGIYMLASFWTNLSHLFVHRNNHRHRRNFEQQNKNAESIEEENTQIDMHSRGAQTETEHSEVVTLYPTLSSNI